jgi:hypothetical protein
MKWNWTRKSRRPLGGQHRHAHLFRVLHAHAPRQLDFVRRKRPALLQEARLLRQEPLDGFWCDGIQPRRIGRGGLLHRSQFPGGRSEIRSACSHGRKQRAKDSGQPKTGRAPPRGVLASKRTSACENRYKAKEALLQLRLGRPREPVGSFIGGTVFCRGLDSRPCLTVRMFHGSSCRAAINVSVVNATARHCCKCIYGKF